MVIGLGMRLPRELKLTDGARSEASKKTSMMSSLIVNTALLHTHLHAHTHTDTHTHTAPLLLKGLRMRLRPLSLQSGVGMEVALQNSNMAAISGTCI